MSGADSPFPNVKFHVVEDTPFVGVKLKTEQDASFIQHARRKVSLLKERMQMAPASCVVEAIGRRPTMEDFHVCKDNVVIPEGRIPGVTHVSFWAVYDGHGGTEAAEFLSRVLFEEIMQNIFRDPANVEEAIRVAFVECDRLLVGKLGNDGLSIGSTAAVALLVGKTLYCANVGDAEAFIGRRDRAKGEFARPVGLTFVHKVNTPEEKARVEAAGGRIFAGRLFGTLAISRAFGDGEMKKPKQEANFVSCEPHVVKMELTPDDEFLVIACDGLFDKVTHDEACQFVAKLLHYKTLEDATEFLLEEALDRNTKDNVTVMVVNLGWSVELGASDSAASLDNLSPAFVQFLQKSSLLSESEDFDNSPVRMRISSPAITVKSGRKDFYLRKTSDGPEPGQPSSVSIEDDSKEKHAATRQEPEGEGPDLMIDVDTDEAQSYEIGATSGSVEIPRDVLDTNDAAVRQATLAMAQEEEARREREEQQEAERKRLEEEDAKRREEEEAEAEERRREEEEEAKQQQMAIAESATSNVIVQTPAPTRDESGSEFDSGESQDEGSEVVQKKTLVEAVKEPSSEEPPQVPPFAEIDVTPVAAVTLQSDLAADSGSEASDKEESDSSEVALSTPGTFDE